MAVNFGYSAGDFIATIKLVVTLSDALRASGQATLHHKQLLDQLSSLEGILKSIDRLGSADAAAEEILALRQTACLCASTIESFWGKAPKYRDLSCNGDRKEVLQTAWRRVKWAVCKKKDVKNLRANLLQHTQSLEISLLLVLK